MTSATYTSTAVTSTSLIVYNKKKVVDAQHSSLIVRRTDAKFLKELSSSQKKKLKKVCLESYYGMTENKAPLKKRFST